MEVKHAEVLSRIEGVGVGWVQPSNVVFCHQDMTKTEPEFS